MNVAQNFVQDSGAAGTFSVRQDGAPRIRVLATGEIVISPAAGQNITYNLLGGSVVDTTSSATEESVSVPLNGSSTASTASFTADAGAILVLAFAAGNGTTGSDAAAVFVGAKATAAASAGLAVRLASRAGAQGEQLVLAWPDGGTGLTLRTDTNVSGSGAYNSAATAVTVRVMQLGETESLLLPLDTTTVTTSTFAADAGAVLALAHGKGNGTSGSDAAAVFVAAKETAAAQAGLVARVASRAGAEGEQLVATWADGAPGLRFATSADVSGAGAYNAGSSVLSVGISDTTSGPLEDLTLPQNGSSTVSTASFTADAGAVLVYAYARGNGTSGSDAAAIFLAAKATAAASAGLVVRLASDAGAQGEQLVLAWPDGGTGLTLRTDTDVTGGGAYSTGFVPARVRITRV